MYGQFGGQWAPLRWYHLFQLANPALQVTPEACLLAYHLTHDVSDRVWQVRSLACRPVAYKLLTPSAETDRKAVVQWFLVSAQVPR